MPTATNESSELWKFDNPRTDGKIAVVLDNNMWNWLFESRTTMRLLYELPVQRFALYITREVEIEHQAIPAEKDRRMAALRSFVNNTIQECGIETTAYFGFETPGVQRYGGFGIGTFMDKTTSRRLDALRHHMRGKRRTGLAHNETDVMLASESFSSVVLTRDCKQGPLREAKNRGGKVLYVEERHAVAGELSAAIEALWPYPPLVQS